jgi:hypothetical protein
MAWRKRRDLPADWGSARRWKENKKCAKRIELGHPWACLQENVSDVKLANHVPRVGRPKKISP